MIVRWTRVYCHSLNVFQPFSSLLNTCKGLIAGNVCVEWR